MSNPLEWKRLERVNWKTRNAAYEAAVRMFLTGLPDTETLSTMELAEFLIDEPGRSDLAKFLAKLAKWVPELATHDGEEIIAYGRKSRRWRWHGQAPSQPMEWTV